jgi:Iron-containing redox enzyme
MKNNALSHSIELTKKTELYVAESVAELLKSTSNINAMTASETRGVIARYSVALEGNFISWMTAAYACSKSETAKAIMIDNLREEIRDNHPSMLRRFVTAARAIPSEQDQETIQEAIDQVRTYLAQMDSVRSIALMAGFETFISLFMEPLAKIAQKRGSIDTQYTDVHGVVDIAHSQKLYEALQSEIACASAEYSESIFEGVDLILNLMKIAICGTQSTTAAQSNLRKF